MDDDDDDDYDEATNYSVSLSVSDDEDGRHLHVRPEADGPTPDAHVFRVWKEEKGKWVRGSGAYADEDGDFVAVAFAPNDVGEAHLYVPSGSVKVVSGRDDVTMVWAYADEQLLGVDRFATRWPPQQMYLPGRILRPLVRLAGLVVQEIPTGEGLEIASRQVH